MTQLFIQIYFLKGAKTSFDDDICIIWSIECVLLK